jgi:hypothetical protein
MNRLFCLLGMAGLLLAAGCRKDDVIDCAPATPNSTLKEFTKRNGAPAQNFILTLGPNAGSQSITTRAGAIITFPSSSFILPNGAAATGTAQVRVREIYSVPDMLLSNMPTQEVGTRRLLISGGEFSIQVWQNGTRLRLATGSPRVVVNSPVPVGAASGQQLVWQQLASIIPDSAAWSQPATRDSVRTITSPNGIPLTYRMPVPLDSVSWWNIDRLWSLYQNASVGIITVQVPAIPATSTGSTQVFLRAAGLNGLARLYPSNTTQTTWLTSMPTGASMKVAVLQSINEQLYFGTQSITTQSGLVVMPTITAVSEADAVRLIQQF